MRIAIIAVLLLSGCSFTPQQVRDSKIGETIIRPGKLSTVAMCVARGFDEKVRTQNNLRLDEAGGRAELIGHDPGADLFSTNTGALVVVDFDVVPEGVRMQYYIRGDILARNTVKKQIREVLEGC